MTYISVWIVISLNCLYPGDHSLLILGLEEIFRTVKRLQAEHILLLGVVIRDVHYAGLD